jgi:small subunit ribosomal protein S16
MALVIRLRKLGAKHKPFFRIAVTEVTSARDGRFVEEIGWYDPKKQAANSKVDLERATYWLSQGAKPSETVRSIFKRHGLLGAKRVATAEAPAEEPAAQPEPERQPEETPEQEASAPEQGSADAEASGDEPEQE